MSKVKMTIIPPKHIRCRLQIC